MGTQKRFYFFTRLHDGGVVNNCSGLVAATSLLCMQDTHQSRHRISPKEWLSCEVVMEACHRTRLATTSVGFELRTILASQQKLVANGPDKRWTVTKHSTKPSRSYYVVLLIYQAIREAYHLSHVCQGLTEVPGTSSETGPGGWIVGEVSLHGPTSKRY